MLKIALVKIIYVSCSGAKQAQALTLLYALYEVTKEQPMEVLSQTFPMENIVFLQSDS